MALKNGLRSKRSKRMCNVLKNQDSRSDEMNFSSSDSESGVSTSERNKVRNGFSTKRLLRESECYKVDSDHIYSSMEFPKPTACGSTSKRKMSEQSDETPVKKKCFSKNAVMARLNRERKKKYVSSLEAENESLQKQNTEMREKIENQIKTIFAMRREILYLKGLLANSKELGQILKNLNETTGLPITSSMALTTRTGHKNKTSEKSSLTDPEDFSLVDYQPRIRSVNSGCNFPILDKDINLCKGLNESLDDMADLEQYPFDFERDSYNSHSPLLCEEDAFFDFNPQNLDLELDESLKFQDFSTKRDPNVGICLHVNQKRVSVEICSICNSRARSSLEEAPSELFQV